MRQIKFRCWTGKWFITDDFYISPEGWIGEMTSTGTYNSFDYIEWKKDWILQQFTGLLDKNGKEIYEGDIIRYIPFNYNKKLINVECFTLNYLHWWSELESMLEEENKCHIEVIGNIYENKDLLTIK